MAHGTYALGSGCALRPVSKLSQKLKRDLPSLPGYSLTEATSEGVDGVLKSLKIRRRQPVLCGLRDTYQVYPQRSQLYNYYSIER